MDGANGNKIMKVIMLCSYHIIAVDRNVTQEGVAGGEDVAGGGVAGGWTPAHQSHNNLQKNMVVIILGTKMEIYSFITPHPSIYHGYFTLKMGTSETKHNLGVRS